MSQEDVIAELRQATKKKTNYDLEALRLLERIAAATDRTSKRLAVIEWLILMPFAVAFGVALLMYGALHPH